MRMTAASKIITGALVFALPGAAFALGDAAVAREPGKLKISWTSPNPVDVFVADRPDASMKAATRVASADRDGKVDFVEPGTVRRYFLLRDTRTGKSTRVAEREIPLAQGSNFRDLGGYPGAGGKHVRWGRIFRSGATPMLTEGDVKQIQALGLRDMIDLRSSEERLLAPTKVTGIRYTAIDYSMMTMISSGGSRSMTNGAGLYRSFPTTFAPQIRIVFEDLLGNKGPVLYHCTAGQDRTGFTSAVVLSALGVPYETIAKDYHLSTALRRPQWELDKIDPALAERNPVAKMFAGYQASGGMTKAQPLKSADGTPFLDGAFAEIKDRWGGIDGYLENEIGLSKADIARLRLIYLE
jgi:protein-tyrosine phosphatase